MAKENVSDRNGRAFEAIVVKTIYNGADRNQLTSEAQKDQERDLGRINDLPEYLYNTFANASRAISKWLTDTYPDIFPCTIDRLPDSCAKAGDVTDIRIMPFNSQQTINISLKNNHHAVKHQRPSALIQQLGIPKGNSIDREYRAKLNEIYRAFYQNATSINPNAINFRDLTSIDSDFVLDNLYSPVCSLVANYIQKYICNQETCLTYFQFLIGKVDYIKMIRMDESLEITDFSAYQLPSSCLVKYDIEKRSYIYLDFNNGWRISMRLHTASSRMGALGSTPSLKFDSQPVETLTPQEIPF